MDDLKPPGHLSFDGDVPSNWENWKQLFELYLTAKELEKKEDKQKIAILLTAMGAEAVARFNQFSWDNEEDKKKYQQVQQHIKQLEVKKQSSVKSRSSKQQSISSASRDTGRDLQTKASSKVTQGAVTVKIMAPPQEDAENNAGAAVAAAEVRYVQAGIQLHIDPFHIPENKLNIGNEWEEWMEIFEEELQLQKVEDIDDKVTCLRRYGGKEIRKLVKHLPEPPAIENLETNYEKIVRQADLSAKKTLR